MYDDLASVYDRFIDWPARLTRELPLLLDWLRGGPLGPSAALDIADVACGTGGHAQALAESGYRLTGFDISDQALDRARASAAARRLPIAYVKAGYGELAATGRGPFDVLYSLGNSLPHITDQPTLHNAFRDFGRVLAPGGRLLIGLRNLPLAMAAGERWLPTKSCLDDDGTEWLFDRFYDWRARGLLDFNFVVYRRAGAGQPWTREVHTTRLRAWPLATLLEVLDDWRDVQLWGDLKGSSFDPARSGDLFLSATRP